MGIGLRQFEEIIPIAGDQHCGARLRKGQHDAVRRVYRKQFPQSLGFMPGLMNDPRDGVGDILIKKKNHLPASAICRATR